MPELPIEPDPSPEALYARAGECFERGQTAAAIELLQAAIRTKPVFAKAHRTLAKLLLRTGRVEEAVAAYQRLAEIDNLDAEDFHELAIALYSRGYLADAARNFEQALQIDPTLVAAQVKLANLYFESREFEAAARHLEAARKRKPHSGEIEGLLHLAHQEMCAWNDAAARADALRKAALKADGLLCPLHALIMPGFDGFAFRRIAECYAERIAADVSQTTPSFIQSHDKAIRIGYISADFQHHHPVGRHILEVLKQHDRAAFKVFGYALKPRHAKNAAFESSFDAMRFLDDRSDQEAADLIRADGIELLIDLGGYTLGARPRILAHRPAPVQINYMGYGGTMGARFIDYMVVDSAVAPPANADFYSESLAYLPHSFVMGACERPEGGSVTRAQIGLPDGCFVFCAFCASYKISEAVFEIWMKLLREVPRSVLWLQDNNVAMRSNLRREAERFGISVDRLIFAPKCSTAKHLARLACANLFLDTPLYNAGSTAADALWAGLPVLTCLGQSFVSRMAAGIVKAAGLPELVTSDLDAYYAKALELAYDHEQLEAYRARLVANRDTSIFFDGTSFTRHLESLYQEMSRRNRCGERPAMIRELL